jgi:hypothetical protein
MVDVWPFIAKAEQTQPGYAMGLVFVVFVQLSRSCLASE